MTVVAYVPDLMDRSRFGGGVQFVSDPADDAGESASLLVIDLSRGGVPAALPTGVRVVGFAPHVDDELLQRAEAAGVEALPRSVFFRRLPELLAEAD